MKDPFYALQPQQPTRAQHPPPNQILPQQPTRVQHPPPTQIQPQQPTRAQHPPPTQIQPQQPTRVQHPPPPQIQTVPSYRPSLPSGSEMPDEWGYPPPSAPQFPSAPFSQSAWRTYSYDFWHWQTYRGTYRALLFTRPGPFLAGRHSRIPQPPLHRRSLLVASRIATVLWAGMRKRMSLPSSAHWNICGSWSRL
jgi:hypothetical protein